MLRSIGTMGLLVLATAPAFAQPPAEGGRRPGSKLVESMDADRDGVLSAEELKNAPAALLALDANKDGKLTEDEYRPQPAGRPGEGRPEGRPADRPAGPNPERMLAHAFEFDADKDGKLDKDELQKFIVDFIARRPAPGADGPPREGRPAGGPAGRPAEVGERPERPKRPE